MLESGSDRIGALDFQRSSSEYIPRSSTDAQLDELLESASRVEQSVPLTPELDQDLFHGSSIGGARQKAVIENQERKYVAKLPLSSDLYNVSEAGFIAIRLAAKAGINVAPVKLIQVKKKDILLIERFGRVRAVNGWERKALVSALTLFGLDEMMAHYASYETFAEIIRHRVDDLK